MTLDRPRHRSLPPATLTAVALILSFHPYPALGQRRVEGTTVTSDTMPNARIEIDTALKYVGTQAITLSGGTKAEQHLFVDAESGRIKRLYWLQFEGKAEGGRPFNYSRDPTIQIAGYPFHTNFRFFPTSGFAGRSGSDGDQAQRLLEREGYTLGTDLMRVRLVWLLDDPPLNELMIIYLEDLADHGLAIEDLTNDDARWRRIAEALQRRAVDGLRLSSPP